VSIAGGAVTKMSTGVRSLDEFLGGLRYGDNVVWEVDGGEETPFVAAFLRGSKGSPLVYVSFHASPQAILDRLRTVWDPEGFVLLDCFTDGLAGGDPAVASFYRRGRASPLRVERVEAPTAPQAVNELLAELELELGRGARYVFDSLTGVQELWGREQALSLFLRSCPRLYDLRTAAYWLLQRGAHDAPFLARLRHVTQVVLELTDADGGTSIRVAKAQARPPGVVGQSARVAFEGGRIRLLPQPPAAEPPFGELLKTHRVARGLSQAELARRIGISPSALSQAERGVSGLSSATLERAREILGLPSEQAFGAPPPYRVRRRGATEPRRVAPGMLAEELADTPGHRILLVRVAPQTSGQRTPFATKREEVVAVLRGILEVRVGESQEVLHAGDTILLSEEPVSSWRNPGPEEADVLWAVLVHREGEAR
jgi:transcriptional regulator with XRE-family HTH domain/KaiC/GvpD/RAD55 family RecA-like ATPase